MTPEEKYQQELIQSEKDHHTPTAGAMIGHILANLHIHQNKLRQVSYYIKGVERSFVQEVFPELISKESRFFDELNYLMLDEDELIPTTTEEFTQYSMLEENGRLKYDTGNDLLMDICKDFSTQLLFITRGVMLSEDENKFGLAEFLKQLYAWIKHQIYSIQSYLGHEVSEGLEEDEEE
ncbi:DNA starvation/stationary phase protection protein [Tetragenococcus halophilus subsp. flandriensis]|uniref:ferritin-like domain-containing protein n=1 Tax=Tetragenococcus halophilus TaxID=51669 RepID=UPI0023EA1D7F|nr:ferritin-like domain-containing protein [Tetragenococcus halophilus]GMA07544.1 DNA starvation/stationary phase protection protein [Tetragenococcus halophilus subsp. flandriensis]